MINPLLSRLGIAYPIIQAPMGGGPSTPALAAAVSNGGCLGSLAAGYLAPSAIRTDIELTKSLTAQPFQVNVFAGSHRKTDLQTLSLMLEFLSPLYEHFSLNPPAPPPDPTFGLAEQIDVIVESGCKAVSFTFGVLSQDLLAHLRAHGITIMGTATTLEEAIILEASAVDAVIVQGEEAGAHRGSFHQPFEEALVPTADLVLEACGRLKLPVIASGGIMDGADVSQMLGYGASAVQMGTAFVVCAESGASSSYKRALLSAAGDSTVLTRAFTGKPARGLCNKFIRAVDSWGGAIPEFPLQSELTKELRIAAASNVEPDFMALWAGRGVARCRALSASELIMALLSEMNTS